VTRVGSFFLKKINNNLKLRIFFLFFLKKRYQGHKGHITLLPSNLTSNPNGMGIFHQIRSLGDEIESF
jgi:hypothetical protein